ncbi:MULTISPECIES: ASCH domain-containing protein [Pseudomonas]|uniref:ASCH domain-containing protein n=1 Tax=Pseudomonas TaxID=286 RepID=UPI000760BF4E|nr:MULTISPECIES: ASCH domain-containing protein [Pseudomonas]MDG9809498.1 ASCH domain-containing protein [Pseudomonas juntendi]MDG9815744.1 ASCH domain-containing protein [Pseudomonas putida]
MKALSIKQPWAWLIIHGGKDIENRTWHTKFRGRFLVHASQGMTNKEYCDGLEFAMRAGDVRLLRDFPTYQQMQRGGIVGSVELVDSVDHSDSSWYMGAKGFVLRDPQVLPFIPYKGRLGFFDVPDEVLP